MKRHRLLHIAVFLQYLIALMFLIFAQNNASMRYLVHDPRFKTILQDIIASPTVWLEFALFFFAFNILLFVKAILVVVISLWRKRHFDNPITKWLTILTATFFLEILLISLNSYLFPFSSTGWLRNTFLSSPITITIVVALMLFVTASNIFKYKDALKYAPLSFLAVFFMFVFGYEIWYQLSLNSTPKTENNQKFPNIVLMSIDSLRPDILGINGFSPSVTPNLDSLLRGMHVFDDAITPIARTHAALVSIFTGQYPKSHGLRFNIAPRNKLSLPLRTLHHLKSLGYKTMFAMDENRFSNIDTDYGFDVRIGPGMGVSDYIISAISDNPTINLFNYSAISRLLFPFSYQNRGHDKIYRPHIFAQNTVMEACDDNHQPLFLSVHLNLPHWPFTSNGMQDIPEHLDKFDPRFPRFYLYLVMSKMADHQLKLIYDGLKKCGRLSNALVFILSDHGEAFVRRADLAAAAIPNTSFRDDQFGHGTDAGSIRQLQTILAMQVFENGSPKLPPVRDPRLTSLVDIMPTIFEFLKQDAQLAFDGKSLMHMDNQFIFSESGVTFESISGKRLNQLKAVSDGLAIYTVSREDGLLYIKPKAYTNLLAAKNRAVIHGDWLLALYPDMKDDLYLVHRKQMRWWPASVAPKEAPVDAMLKALCEFYRGDYGFDPHHLCQKFARSRLDGKGQDVEMRTN